MTNKAAAEGGRAAAGRLPVAIIGLGRIASLLEDDALREKPCTHAGAAAADSGCVLAGGMDTSAARGQLFSRRWNVPVFDDAAAMLRAVQPAILCVATPPDSHLFYCALGASMNVPLVICEKPLAHTLWAAKRICAIHEAGGTKIMVNHERRYAEDYRAVTRFLREGGAGGILSVSAKLYMGRDKRLLDVLWHDGTHLVDAIMFLTGRVLTHKKRFSSGLRSREGSVFLLGTLEPDIPVVIEVGARRDHLVFEIEVSCERGRARIGNGVFVIETSAPSSYAQNFRSLYAAADRFSGPTRFFANMLSDAAACVRDSAREPVSSARAGFAAIRYLHSVHPWW